MARTAQIVDQLPDRTFRRNVKPPKSIPVPSVQKRKVANLGSRTARRALILGVADEIVTALRSKHVQVTRDEVIRAQGLGYLQDEVAVIVDGSPSRPVRNVQFAGQIVHADNPRNRGQVVDAASTAYLLLTEHYRGWKSNKTRAYKGHSRTWGGGLRILVDQTKEIQPSALPSLKQRDDWQRISIVNNTPYAHLQELHYNEPFRWVWKHMRSRGWTKRASIRFLVDTNPTYVTQQGSGVPRPRIDFQRLGEFTSRGPNRSDYK